MALHDELNGLLESEGLVMVREADLRRVYALADSLGFGAELRALGVMVHRGFDPDEDVTEDEE
jgi:hypothetical protein